MTQPINAEDMAVLLAMQENEETEALVYRELAKLQKDEKNAGILLEIGDDEARHAGLLKDITGKDVSPRLKQVFQYVFMARAFGLTFALKKMENGEDSAHRAYEKLQDRYSVLGSIALDEHRHEQALIGMLDDERLSYMGSIVLGLNDALVELTGALAGFTFALKDARLVAVTGLITGLSASMSMAASGYLAARAEKQPDKPPLKAAAYTGVAYVITVILLVTPFFLFGNARMALLTALGMAFAIIAVFNYYLAVACDEPFWKRFGEMAALSGGVALISFLIGLLLQYLVPSA